MSIIAYRDGTMASDSGVFKAGVVTHNSGSKLIRGKQTGWLYGFVGTYALVSELKSFIQSDIESEYDPQNESFYFSRLFSKVKQVNSRFEDNDEISVAVMVVRSQKQVDILHKLGHDDNMLDEKGYAVIGAPFDIALGAMYMGATACQAVDSCVYHSEYAKGRVEYIQL